MKQPIKSKKKYKLYNPNGLDRGATPTSNNIDIYLTKSSYGETPLIDNNLPTNHPANVRAVIAQKQGWVEVPISEIDLDANRQWQDDINKAASEYGTGAKYIVDPNTRKIIPDHVFDLLLTEIAFQNTSGAIQDSKAAFEVQLAQNHRDLQRRDPQGLGYVTLGAGMVSNPVGWTALGILTSADYFQNGMKRAYNLWDQGHYGAAIGEGVGTTALSASPFNKVGTVFKWLPRIALPVAAGLDAMDAYALGQVPQKPVIGNPKEFKAPSLSQEDIDLVMDDNTDWEAIGNSNEARERWNEVLKKELNRAGFTIKEATDDLGQPALNIYGYKILLDQDQNKNNKGSDFYGTAYWTGFGLRYSPFAIKGGSILLKKYWPKVAEKLAQAWNWITSQKGWMWYTGANAVGDGVYAYYANQGTEETPDEFDENLARYWNKLINAYIRLNSSERNGYAVASTFTPEQSYKDEYNIMKPGNLLFDKPDTNQYRIIKARPVELTPSIDTTIVGDLGNRSINYDSLENAN